MLQWLINIWRMLSHWHQLALKHAAALKQSPTLPAWLALIVVLLDFVLVGVWFRCTRGMSIGEWAVSDFILYLTRLAAVTVTIVLGCKHYRISAQTLGILPSNLISDLRWSLNCCLLGASIIAVVIAACFVAACWLGIRLPAPPLLVVELVGASHWSPERFILLGGLGATGVLLAPFTEELIYRSLLLPALTFRLGLYLAVAVTAGAFGLVHVIPLGVIDLPAPQILGGLMMAAAFSIRWSVVPAMVLHAMGNLFVGLLCVIYVRLYEAYPTLFLAH